MTDYEPMRCELDRRGGGVCLRRLRRDGTCPGENDHWAVCICDHAAPEQGSHNQDCPARESS